jgi:hypothetical protein
VRADDNINAANILKTSAPNSMVWAIASLEDVTVNMVEETIPSNAPQTIALLRLDTDWHASTKLNSTIRTTACVVATLRRKRIKARSNDGLPSPLCSDPRVLVSDTLPINSRGAFHRGREVLR